MVDDINKNNITPPNPAGDEIDFDLSDEIVVKDKDGSFKVIIGGEVKAEREESKGEESPRLPEDSREIVAKEKTSAQIAPPPPAIPQDQGTAFFFDVEDEEEVKKIAAEKELSPDSFDAGSVAAEIIKQSNLQLSAEKYKRVIDILISRLKQIREKHDTLVKLTDATSGAGLDREQAQKLIDLTERFLAKREKGEITTPSTSELDQVIAQAEDVYQIEPETDQEGANPPQPASYEEAIVKDLASSKPELIKEPTVSPPPEPPSSLPVDLPPADEKKETKGRIVGERPLPHRRTISQSGKPRLEDVKIRRKLLGPIDELKYLTIDELRRWGGSSADRIAKIKQKIDALEDESFAKKVEGIKAWRSSPLYQLYLQIGRDSMEQGKPVRDVIAARQSQGQESLTWEEFTLISDLNQQLRF